MTKSYQVSEPLLITLAVADENPEGGNPAEDRVKQDEFEQDLIQALSNNPQVNRICDQFAKTFQNILQSDKRKSEDIYE